MRPGVGVLACLLMAVAGCASTARADGPDAHESRGALDVRCDEDGVRVGASEVYTTEAGVPLLVSSTAPAGTYVNLAWKGGGQGDPAPATATPWNIGAPPGRLEIGCSNLDVPEAEWPRTTVTVHDEGHWRGRALADYECGGNSTSSWVDMPLAGQNATSESAALEGVIPLFKLDGDVDIEPTEIGYAGADRQTWIVSEGDEPYIAVDVIRSGDRYTASPSVFCG